MNANQLPSRCPVMRAVRALRTSQGFTLIELLVVIAIIGLLIAIMVPAYGRARLCVRQARESSTAKQLLTGFTAYANDYRDAILPGYPPLAWVNSGQVLDRAGQPLVGEVAQRYPWRIAPYLGMELRGIYEDPRLLQSIFEQEPVYIANGRDANYVVSLFPTFGMNAAFVGGSDRHEEFSPLFTRLFGRVYVAKMSEVQRSSQLMAFASSRSETIELASGIPAPEGFFRIEPPVFAANAGPQWDSQYDPRSQTPEQNSGHISLRYVGKAVVSYMDGHAASADWEAMNDMRLWADQATSPTWGLTPR